MKGCFWNVGEGKDTTLLRGLLQIHTSSHKPLRLVSLGANHSSPDSPVMWLLVIVTNLHR